MGLTLQQPEGVMINQFNSQLAFQQCQLDNNWIKTESPFTVIQHPVPILTPPSSNKVVAPECA